MPKSGGREPITPPEIPVPPAHAQTSPDGVQVTLLLSVGELKGRVALLEDQVRRMADRLEKVGEKLYLALGGGAVMGFVAKWIIDAVKK
ncbi:MAG: hypothetical protein ACLP59_26075 [Bryobacteraceae bacterium]